MKARKQGRWFAPHRWRSRSFATKALVLVSGLLLAGFGSAWLDRHPAASMASGLGLPEQFLVGLGNADAADIRAQQIKVDILDHYLVGVGESSWANWNAPRGDYIRVVTEKADALGAVPMFTLAQMPAGDAEKLSSLNNRAFMAQYWSNVRLLFFRLGQYDSPALLNVEPDFWGHAQKESLNGDPATLAAVVSINPDCKDLPDNLAGMAACFLRSAHQHAPRTQLGFALSDWGASSPAEVASFMKRVGANRANFIVLPSEKLGATAASFREYVDRIRFYHEAMGGLPVLAWRAPLAAGGDGSLAEAGPGSALGNILKQPGKLVAAGAIGVVFCAGESAEAGIAPDDRLFRILSFQYSLRPAPLS